MTNQVATAIANFQDFKTHGALSGEAVSDLPEADYGWLTGLDKEQFVADSAKIRYVVRSYATPIAWYANGKWYKVKQKFSVTTSKHQGQLWKI